MTTDAKMLELARRLLNPGGDVFIWVEGLVAHKEMADRAVANARAEVARAIKGRAGPESLGELGGWKFGEHREHLGLGENVALALWGSGQKWHCTLQIGDGGRVYGLATAEIAPRELPEMRAAALAWARGEIAKMAGAAGVRAEDLGGDHV